MMREAARSFTEPPGSYHSALPRISTSGRSLDTRSRRSRGVLPTRSMAFRPSFGTVVLDACVVRVGSIEGCPMVDKPAVTIVMCQTQEKEVSNNYIGL